MTIHPFDLLELNQEGAGLLLTPCPGTRGQQVATALEQLQAAGAEAVLTLMPETEMASNGVSNLGQLCTQRGLQWFHLPIQDECSPAEDFAREWQKDRAAVHQLLSTGKKIAIHCKGGSGRTGLMAAQILVERGWSKEEATAAVKRLRPNSLTLTVHQDYLTELARRNASVE